jgi:FAD synthetase
VYSFDPAGSKRVRVFWVVTQSASIPWSLLSNSIDPWVFAGLTEPENPKVGLMSAMDSFSLGPVVITVSSVKEGEVGAETLCIVEGTGARFCSFWSGVLGRKKYDRRSGKELPTFLRIFPPPVEKIVIKMTTKIGIRNAIIRLWYYTVGMRKRKRVVIFGIFDGVHAGHRSLFRQARKYGDDLIVIVGRDSASLRWKGKNPMYSQETRLSLVVKEKWVDQAVLGDEEQSIYRVLEELQPDVICLGYDQEALAVDLKLWLQMHNKNTPAILLKPFKPNTHHTSLLKKK